MAEDLIRHSKEHLHRERERYRSKWLGLQGKLEEKTNNIVSAAVVFGGGVVGGILQGMSKSPHGPRIGPVPAELVIGGGLIALGALDVAGETASRYFTEFGKGIAVSYGVDWGHHIGERKKLKGSFFEHKTISSGVPNPQAMADALLNQARGG